MLILTLDTTTRAGSVGVFRRDSPIAVKTGDPTRTHGERLPEDIIRLLTRAEVSLEAIDVFAVAIGPGSFTGLRIGIATMQGLALAHGKGLIGVSALDALAVSAQRHIESTTGAGAGAIGVWMDAQRQEVFAAVYRGADLTLLDGPLVGSPDDILARWAPRLPPGPAWFIGDGVIRYRSVLAGQTRRVIEPTPVMAPAMAELASRLATAGPIPSAYAIRPLYVRRPDAELARERARARTDSPVQS